MGTKVQSLPVLSPTADLAEVRRVIDGMLGLLRAREPSAVGDIFSKYITYQRAVELDLITYAGGAFGSTGGGTFVPSPKPPDFGDGPPDPLTGLAASSSVAYVLVSWDAPTYGQGGGNAYTEVFAANYSGTGPEPTFADAVQVGTASGRSPIFVMDAEPGVEKRFWVGAVTYGGIRQVDATGPTGGLHGVAATADLIDSQHIISLTAAKITAGSIAVGEDITSSGFVSGSAGWRIQGSGNAEFNNVDVRGNIYASGGLIGGAIIGSTGVESDNYVSGSLGWRLDNATGEIRAYAGKIADFTIAGKVLTLGTADLDGTGVGIAMGTDTDTLNKLMVGDGDGYYLYFDGTDLKLKAQFEAFGAALDDGLLDVTVGNGLQDYGERTVTASGGRPPYTYVWGTIQGAADDPGAVVYVSFSGGPETVSVSGYGTNVNIFARVNCTVIDSNQRAATVGFNVTAMHGSPP